MQTFGGGDGPSRVASPGGRRIESRVVVGAPAGTVWSILADVDGWSRWSGLYTRAQGELAVGRGLDLCVALPGMKPQAARAVVQSVAPGELLAYRTRTLGGLVTGERYIDLRPLGADRCEVANGEVMGGLLGPLLARVLRARIEQAFAGMNEALKRLAEQGPDSKPG